MQDAGQIGFHWAPHGAPISLQDLALTDDEPDVLVATHLEALDDALIIAVGRCLLGPSPARRPTGPSGVRRAVLA